MCTLRPHNQLFLQSFKLISLMSMYEIRGQRELHLKGSQNGNSVCLYIYIINHTQVMCHSLFTLGIKENTFSFFGSQRPRMTKMQLHMQMQKAFTWRCSKAVMLMQTMEVRIRLATFCIQKISSLHFSAFKSQKCMLIVLRKGFIFSPQLFHVCKKAKRFVCFESIVKFSSLYFCYYVFIQLFCFPFFLRNL